MPNSTRRIFAPLLWLVAAILAGFLAWMTAGLTSEYGISPNNNPVRDVGGTYLAGVLPLSAIIGGLTWAGYRLWRPATAPVPRTATYTILGSVALGVALIWIAALALGTASH